jgi:cell division protein FtsI (penicillin-binding protein 3)
MQEPSRRGLFMRARIVMLATLLGAGASAVVYRAWDLQVRRAATLREMAEEQYLRAVSLAPKRGTIYDRDGAELAVSIDADSVWANPAAIKKAGQDPRAVAARLSPLLGLDAEVLAQRLAAERHFVWVKRRVTPAQGKAVRALHLPGVAISEEARRFYPNRELAAHVLGFANIDGVGIEGLELALEDKLRGPQQSIPAVLDRRGEIVFSQQLLDERNAQGDEVTLTLDKTLQYLAERELELAVRSYEARAGSIVLIEPSTGEILAMANYPTFNPNEPNKATGGDRRNRAITDRFEPGSTIKPFTVSGALAAGAVSPTQIIDCENGAVRVAEYTIHDSHHFQLLTPAQVLSVSSNIGAAKIGLAMGRAGLYRALTRFGLGERTGIELPGETAGILRHYKRWYDMDAATIAFGQGVSTTALQLAMGLGAIANQGRLMQPQIIKRIVDGHGDVVQAATPHVRRQVIPENVARLVSDMLVAVTEPGGTGVEAAIPGYLVAGKTGTAQKADYLHGGYADNRWTSSFVGYAPAQQPRLLAAVVLDEPLIAHQGGSVAAPVFRRVVGAALRHLGVPGDNAGSLAEQAAPRKIDANKLATAAAAAAAAVAPSEAILAEGEVLVPSVLGQSARAAIALLRQAEFDVRVQGSGVVSAQEPAAASVAHRGALVSLRLASPNGEPVVDSSTARATDVPAQPAAAAPAEPAAGHQLIAAARSGGHDG